MNVRQIFNWNLIFRKFEETPNTQKYENRQWRKTKWQSRGKNAKRQFLPRKTKQASRKKIKHVCHLLKSQKRTKAFFKVSQRFFPVLKWTTNSWRGIKKPLSLTTTRKSCKHGLENGKQKLNRRRRRSDNGRHIYRRRNKYPKSRCYTFSAFAWTLRFFQFCD